MTRAEEKALIHAVLEIGRRIAAEPLPDDGVYDVQDNRELRKSLIPLRRFVDAYDRSARSKGAR